MKSIKTNIQYIIITFLALIAAGSCNNNDPDSTEGGDGVISITLQGSSSSINQDKLLWEDRVDELRIIIFSPNDGAVIINQKAYFPDGFENKSKGIRIKPGTYNFYFIANESVYPGSFIDALNGITNESNFDTEPIFSHIIFNPNFAPDETSTDGRFLMSAIYDNITVNKGGTEDNPSLLVLPTEKVELIRSLAKVEVFFKKKTAGSVVPFNTISSVQLEHVASDISVPPLDYYYDGDNISSRLASLSRLDYNRDSIGGIVYYVPEMLTPRDGNIYTELVINNQAFPIQTDAGKTGIILQRRTVPDNLSTNSVIRNYHYIVNVYVSEDGGLQVKSHIQPWNKDEYKYIFEGDQSIIVPPVIPTDSSLIIPTDCGKIEMMMRNENLTSGLQGAFGDEVIWWDNEIGGPRMEYGDPPYYCEKKYGEGWRLINSCELMEFLALFDTSYKIWMSNTWAAENAGLPFYPIEFRQEAQKLLEKLTDTDLSGYVLTDNGKDPMNDEKLNMVDHFFTPGDIVVRENDYPDGEWPYPSPPNNQGLPWYPSEVVLQVKAFFYKDYVNYSNPDNKEKILYNEFVRYDYGKTVSRCVRSAAR